MPKTNLPVVTTAVLGDISLDVIPTRFRGHARRAALVGGDLLDPPVGVVRAVALGDEPSMEVHEEEKMEVHEEEKIVVLKLNKREARVILRSLAAAAGREERADPEERRQMETFGDDAARTWIADRILQVFRFSYPPTGA